LEITHEDIQEGAERLQRYWESVEEKLSKLDDLESEIQEIKQRINSLENTEGGV